MGRYVIRQDIVNSREGEHILFLPGILARAREQFAPINMSDLLRDATVSVFDYTEPLDVPGVVSELVEIIRNNIGIHQKTILVGASFGGMVAAEVMKELREQAIATVRLQAYVSCIIIDAPSRGESLVQPLPVGVAKWLTSHFTPDDNANTGYGAKLLKAFMGLPKREETEPTSQKSYEDIKEEARRNLSEHNFTLWYKQLKWMLSAQLDLTALNGLNAIYIACTKGNGTVIQPWTMRQWKSHVRQLTTVPAPHCSFLQQEMLWRRVMAESFSQLRLWWEEAQ